VLECSYNYVFPQTVVSVSLHSEHPAKRVGLEHH